jgi:hypothetical protein
VAEEALEELAALRELHHHVPLAVRPLRARGHVEGGEQLHDVRVARAALHREHLHVEEGGVELLLVDHLDRDGRARPPVHRAPHRARAAARKARLEVVQRLDLRSARVLHHGWPLDLLGNDAGRLVHRALAAAIIRPALLLQVFRLLRVAEQHRRQQHPNAYSEPGRPNHPSRRRLQPDAASRARRR